METSATSAIEQSSKNPQDGAGQKQPSRIHQILLGAVQPILTALLVLLLWQVIVILFGIPKYIIPAPSAIISKGVEYAPKIWFHYSTTLRSAALGYALAVVVAIPIALIVAFSTFAQKTLYPGLILIHMTPKVTLAPLIIAWMGFGVAPKVVVTFLLCFMPIMLNGILGFRSIDPEIIYLCQSTGVRQWEMFWKIRLPNALPTLFTGLKHGASLSIVGAVVAEYIGGNRGLGYYLILLLDNMQVDVGMAVMASMATIGLIFFFGMHLVERLTIPWYVAKRRASR
jgi:NitT/TauT family transport system permease protein